MMDNLAVVENQFEEFGGQIAEVERAFTLDDFAITAPRSIQIKKLNTAGYEAPVSVYMIYMKFDANGRFVVKQVSEQDYADTLADSEARLLDVARGAVAPSGNIRVEGENFERIIWYRPYYLTFVIDNPGWKIYWGRGGLDDPIRFLKGKPGSTTPYITENYTFFDAEAVPHLGADAFRCINYHHRDEFTHELLHGDTRDYCFLIHLLTPFAGVPNPNSHIVVIVDPDGQNQGPRT